MTLRSLRRRPSSSAHVGVSFTPAIRMYSIMPATAPTVFRLHLAWWQHDDGMGRRISGFKEQCDARWHQQQRAGCFACTDTAVPSGCRGPP